MVRLGTAVLLLALAGTAAAQDGVREQEAAQRFDNGVKYYNDGNYTAALAEFEAAYQVTGAWQVLFNMGVTQRRLYRYNDAVRTLEQYLAEGREQVAAARRAEVEAELAEVRKVTAEVTVRVDGAPARIEIDDGLVGHSPLARPVLVASGPHRVRASRPGQVADEKSIVAISGARIEVVLAPHPARPRQARLTVTSKPAGAALFIDGRPMGATPWTGDLDAGGHRVLVRRAGFADGGSELVLVAGQTRTVDLELPAKARGRAWYKRWYVWAAVGAVVVGGVTTAVVVASQPEAPDVAYAFP